jgi:hypothetical protein
MKIVPNRTIEGMIFTTISVIYISLKIGGKSGI